MILSSLKCTQGLTFPDQPDPKKKLMNTMENIKERFNQWQSHKGSTVLQPMEQNAFRAFQEMGIPTVRHEEWKYTRIGSVFNKDYEFTPGRSSGVLSENDLTPFHLPDHAEANSLVFVNGTYSPQLSVFRSKELVVLPLQEAAENEYSELVSRHLGQSSRYVKDGIHALNTAFVQGGVFIQVKRGQVTEHPLYIYYVTDARSANILSQPRNLIHIAENAQVMVVETSVTLGSAESFTSQVMEIVVERDADVEYYKIQNDATQTSQVSTTLFRQVGKSMIHAVTVSLNGGLVRNNLNIALEAEHGEAHLYGLYFLNGNSHIDNHTVVDHVKPNCQSNQLYKGIIDDKATAVFNGKIFVQQQAQKTNAYQSNKNILLSESASVNAKPQLEIFADDVKCSHGCTIGRLDEEGMFYMRSRGIPEKMARNLLVHAFAMDILDHIKLAPVRQYIDQLIEERLEFVSS
jgi:Fe-S cluster assembly protein SufD